LLQLTALARVVQRFDAGVVGATKKGEAVSRHGG
jgi:hypothetical protein